MISTALDVARSAGLQLVQRGVRWWARCPGHTDKTPSLCLFADGHFHCFACGAHGYARALYRLITGKELPGVPPARRQNPARDLYKKLDMKFRRINAAAAELRVAAQLTLDDVSRNDAWDNPLFCFALAERSRADYVLNQLDTVTAAELKSWKDMENADYVF